MRRRSSTPRAKAIKPRKRKYKHKTERQKLEELAHDVCREFVFARDPWCVTCGMPREREDIVFHPSHVFPRTRDTTAYDPDNVYRQCKTCHFKHHNERFTQKPLLDYVRKRLGEERLDAMEFRSNHVANYTMDDLRAIIADLRQRRRELEGRDA